MTEEKRSRTVVNAVRNALRPGYGRVMVGKVYRRAVEWRRGSPMRVFPAATRLAPAEYCTAIDPDLWAEANAVGEEIRERARALRRATGEPVRGGARFELLYFLARRHRPEVVLETGVAAGFSSAALLAALERNGTGHLYSSDFPYFRTSEPERHVGVLVPDDLRHRWTLLLGGDRANLPEILRSVERVDLFHYDSDKSYGGRRFAMELVAPRLADGAVVLMDDIQDNTYFYDHVTASGVPFVVFGRGRNGVGAIGLEPPRA